MSRNVTPQLNKLVYNIEKILNRIPHDIKHKGGFFIDHYMKECLETVDRVNKFVNITTRQKLKAKKRIFKVYFKLQKYKGPHVSHHDKQRIIYAGGLGYASVSRAILTERMGKTVNHYWKPTKPTPIIYETDGWSYQGKETMEEWKAKMTAEKESILNELL